MFAGVFIHAREEWRCGSARRAEKKCALRYEEMDRERGLRLREWVLCSRGRHTGINTILSSLSNASVCMSCFSDTFYKHRPTENLLRHVSEIHPVCIKSVLRTLKWMHVQLRQKSLLLCMYGNRKNLREQIFVCSLIKLLMLCKYTVHIHKCELTYYL